MRMHCRTLRCAALRATRIRVQNKVEQQQKNMEGVAQAVARKRQDMQTVQQAWQEKIQRMYAQEQSRLQTMSAPAGAAAAGGAPAAGAGGNGGVVSAPGGPSK